MLGTIDFTKATRNFIEGWDIHFGKKRGSYLQVVSSSYLKYKSNVGLIKGSVNNDSLFIGKITFFNEISTPVALLPFRYFIIVCTLSKLTSLI